MVSSGNTARKGLGQGHQGSAQEKPMHQGSKADAALEVSASKTSPPKGNVSVYQPRGQEIGRTHDVAGSTGLKFPAKKPKHNGTVGNTNNVTKPVRGKVKTSLGVVQNDNNPARSRPLYRSTQNPIGTKLCEAAQGWYWKISDDVSVETSSMAGNQGTVTEYNLTQMNSHWIKILVSNLKDVAQIKCSVRGWKETLLYSLGVANVPDNGDLELEKQISEVRKQLKKGTISETEAERKLQELENELSTWTPAWYCEPLYEMKIIRNAFEDRQIILVQLSSTEGDFFIRTKSDFDPWKQFINWLEVKQANMHGYTARRNNTEWNGFDMTKKLVRHNSSTPAQMAEIEMLFSKHRCVAVWKTRNQYREVDY